MILRIQSYFHIIPSAMSTFIQKSTLLIALLGFANLANAQNNIKAYYFPISEISNPKVYKFVDANNPENIVYWHLSAIKNKDEILLITRAFNVGKVQIEFFEERITARGAFVARFTDIYDGKNKRYGRVTANEVFIWKKSKPYSFKIFVDSGKYIFEKHRKSISSVFTKEINNVNRKCIAMDDFYITRNIETESVIHSFKQETIYAENLGIVAYKRWLPEGRIFDFRLEAILTAEGFTITE